MKRFLLATVAAFAMATGAHAQETFRDNRTSAPTAHPVESTKQQTADRDEPWTEDALKAATMDWLDGLVEQDADEHPSFGRSALRVRAKDFVNRANEEDHAECIAYAGKAPERTSVAYCDKVYRWTREAVDAWNEAHRHSGLSSRRRTELAQLVVFCVSTSAGERIWLPT